MEYRYCRYIEFKQKIDKYRKIISSCSICKGEGFVPTGKPLDKATFEFKDCECKSKFSWIKDCILSNVPKKRFGLLKEKKKRVRVVNTITNEKVSLYSSIIKRYVKTFEKAKSDGLGLIFFGNSGSGKTTAALYILLKLMKKGENCYYIYFKDLIGLIITSYDDKLKSQLFREITEVELLVIDGLSLVSRVTPHMVAEFTSLCKQRFESERPTLLVSNYKTINEIHHNFGTPMESLLNEAFIAFRFGKRDLREDKYEYMKNFFE